MVTQQNTAVSSATFSATLSSGKKYFWRVRANTGSGYSGWSPVRTFTIFSPSDIGVSTWYKADYGVQLDGNGFIYQWDDASGNGNHAVQSNTSFRPVLVSSVPEINSKPLIRFDGANDYLLFSTYLTSVETIFWVIKEDADATNLYRSILGDYNNQPDFHRGCCDGGWPGPTRYIYDDQYSASQVRNGTTRVNGNVVPAMTTNVPTSMSIISTKTTGNAKAGAFSIDRPWLVGEYRTWDGDLAELIFFNDPLSDSLINLVTEYLQYKYAPPANLGADRVESYKLCNTVMLSLNNYYKSYSWSTGATTSSIQVTSPGTYWVSVTNQFNRVSRDSVEVRFARPHVITPTTICLGDSIVWNTGMGAGYEFEWQDGSTNSSFVIREEGDYWVIVTDSSGCSYQTPAVHISVDSFAARADLGPDTFICQGQSIGLVNGASLAIDYLWSTGETESSISIFTSGTYHLTVSDSYGCPKYDSIFVNTGANAPITNFIAPDVCFGSSTSFTDATTISQPNIIVSWQWMFGDGATDTVANPVHTYNAPGSYYVTLLTTADNLCTHTKTKTVRVHSLPQPLFHDSIACAGKPHVFQDASSVEPGATISSWYWNFGDNSASSQQNPSHQFNSTDTFTVSLAVIDSRGCNSSFTRAVASIPPPVPAESPNLLLPSQDVTLSSSPVLFDWQPAENAFYYSLQIATDAAFTNLIRDIQEISTDSFLVRNLPFGATYYWRVLAFNMCGDYSPSGIRHFKLFQPSVLPGLCLWLSSDRGIYTDINEAVQDWLDNSQSGNDAGQPNSLRRPTFIEHIPKLNGLPVLRFDGLDDYVQFNRIDSIRTVFWVVKEDSNATTFYRHLLGNTTAQPDFHRGCCDDGFPGTKKYIYDNDYAGTSVITGTTRINGNTVNPLQTNVPTDYAIITTKTAGKAKADCFSCDRPSQLTTDQRYWDGDLAELIVFCEPLSDSLMNMVESYLRYKYAPPVNIGPDVVLEYGFCAPTTLRAGKWFASYLWSTGETTESISVTAPGTYWVRATDIFGYTSYDEVVIRGGLNLVTFSDTFDICMGDSLIWDTQLGYDYSFRWQDNSTQNFYVIRDTGRYWVTVTDTFGCSVTTDTVYIRIDSFSAEATLGADTNLCSGNRIGLTQGAEVTSSYRWNDGSAEPVFVVNQTGDYSVTVENINHCIASDTIHVNIIGIAPDADFSYEGICLNDTTQFTDHSAPPIIATWNWDFDDGSGSVTQNPAHLFTNSGTYEVTLTVRDTVGCFQSVTKQVIVFPLPVADFYHDVIKCAADEVRFFDTSSVAAGQSIISRSWTMGDGTFVTDENPVHIYQTQGLYPVSLKVTTDKGCSNMTYQPVEIFPELIADIRVENLCFDYPTNFFDNSPGFSNVSWYWDFGNHLGRSFKKNPTYSYYNPGTYVVSLRVTNAIGCVRTVTKTITITARPEVDFETPDLCEEAPFHFSDGTITNGGDDVVEWRWNFGDLSPEALVANPVHSYAEAGQYFVSLNVRTENGCESFAAKTINVVKPPVANFTFTPTYGPAPITIHFTNHTTEGISYQWDFGDNSTSNELNPIHTYLQNDSVNIMMIASNLPGCSDTMVKSLRIAVATLDIALDKIIIEKSFNNDCSYYIDMGAYVQNIGTRSVTSFDILASASDGGALVEHWTGEFNNRQVTYEFYADYLISDCEKDVVICMEVMNPNGEQDENPLNDRSCVTLSSEPVIIGPYPNPAKDLVSLDVVLPAAGILKIHYYNTMGYKLGMMADGFREKGYHRISMETRDFLPGVYLLKIEFKEEMRTAKFAVR